MELGWNPSANRCAPPSMQAPVPYSKLRGGIRAGRSKSGSIVRIWRRAGRGGRGQRAGEGNGKTVKAIHPALLSQHVLTRAAGDCRP